jgi:hypothetical protein
LKILQGFVMHMTLMMLLFYHRLDQLGTIAMSVDREHWIHWITQGNDSWTITPSIDIRGRLLLSAPTMNTKE